MSTPSNKLLFFDKEGYPYNLNYNIDKKEWEGKIYFDENGNDTFKTLCMYLFENVDPFTFNDTFDLRSSQLFNYSGFTFIPSTFLNEPITNVEKVNNSPLFYSKWFYGDNFDKKFPVGTVIKFDGLTGTTTITNDDIITYSLTGVSGSTSYYNVLGTKKNAFLINTYTNNKDFDFIFSGGTVSSVSVFKISDYGKQNLVDLNNLNYYKYKKLSIDGSDYNDGVYTYNDYNILKTKIYDFELPSINYTTGLTLNLDFYLMTQRPELYEGNVNITYIDNTINGTVIEFTNYINTNIDFTTTGQTIIFEKIDGKPIHESNPEFLITGFIDRENITTQKCNFIKNNDVNIIELSSDLNYELYYNDYIELTAYPYLSGKTYHDKRQFQVLNLSGNIIQVRDYIIPESGYTYKIDKVINKRKIKKLYCQQIGVPTPDNYSGYSICYSTSNRITLSQSILPSGNTEYFYENTISALRNKYRTLLERYGLNLYHYNDGIKNYMIFDGLDYNYQPYYSGATSYINNIPLNISNNFTYLTSASTVQDSDIFYFEIFENFKKYEKTYYYDKTKLSKNFRSEIYLNINKDSTNFGFNLKLNDIDYFIQISGTTNNYSENTINSFISKYEDIFNSKGIYIYSGYTNDIYTGYTLIIESQKPNIILYDLEIKVNNYSSYDILNIIKNKSVIIDSSELYLTDINKSLYDYELSTGMIINITECSNKLNNKQYNILRLTPNIIQLSYQGPFLYEYNSNIKISVDSFLRKPRGGYDKDVKYKFRWEPIEENDPKVSPNIFYYDYSGEQLKDNGDLTYIGEKPLWNENEQNLVFLNREQNKNILYINNPEYQQTVFDELEFNLEKLNSSNNYNYVPSPLQVFIGFNSKDEGVVYNELIIERIDNIILSGVTSNITNNKNYSKNFKIIPYENKTVILYETDEPFFNFLNLGFNINHHISLNFLENVLTGHTLFENYDIYEIIDVTNKTITLKEILKEFDTSLNNNTYNFIIKTEPDRIAKIKIYGQTEIEDDRYVQHLKLLGANIDTEIQYIFKESDINEAGIDYTILNRKRKELLSIYPEIYNYIGSYKALINSINFFGYNDLDLYEYYRNIKKNSPLYGKLQKVLIEDIFINTIPGWNDLDVDNNNYLKTNLFNLTYKITDLDGNYVEMYSLDEVQQKLTKLVKWLRKNIIPLSSNILDITGVANSKTTLYANYDASNYVKKIIVNQSNSAINFYHIQTLNIDTNYLFTLNFYLTEGSIMPKYWTAKIKTFHLNENTNELEPVQYINLYKTDLLSYSFNVDKNIDPYVYIETQSYNDYGLGYTNNKLFNYNEGRNFVLINNNFQNINYKYLNDYYGYYIITDGRFYIIKF